MESLQEIAKSISDRFPFKEQTPPSGTSCDKEFLAALTAGKHLSLNDFIREYGNEFRPFAHFDRPLDRIRVLTDECSVGEVYLTRLFSILLPNHGFQPRNGKSAGFIVGNVTRTFKVLGLPLSGSYPVMDLLGKIGTTYPDAAVSRIVAEFGQALREESLCVDFDL